MEGPWASYMLSVLCPRVSRPPSLSVLWLGLGEQLYTLSVVVLALGHRSVVECLIENTRRLPGFQ